MSKIITPEGISIKKEGLTIFWGNKFFDLNKFKKINNINSTGSCQQFHSNIMLESIEGSPIPKCDAIYTEQKNYALAIKTADCVPVVVKHKNYIFALHAGWRGLSSRILMNLKKFKIDETSIAFIGPHISHNSYEVGEEVVAEILNNNPELKGLQSRFVKPFNNKFLLNLSALTKIQLTEVGFDKKNITTEDIDTLTNEKWNSYRREKDLAGRNISLIIQH